MYGIRTFVVAAALSAGVGLVPSVANASSVPAPVQFDGPSCGNIVYGDYDGCVTSLQENLNNLGFGLSVDGQFGNGTLAAVKWVQTKAHLTDSSVSIDGQVGPVTKSKIRYFEFPTYAPMSANVYAGNAACIVQLDPHPGAQTASGVISDSGGTCAGAMYLSRDGGKSWIQSSGYHTITSGYVQFYSYADTASELERVCVTAISGSQSSSGCTVGF